MAEVVKTKKLDAKKLIKSAAWLVEAAFRGFVGYVMLVQIVHNYLTLVASGYALFTAAAIVVTHFVKANQA